MRASSPAASNDPRHAAPATPDGYMEAVGDVAFRLDPSGLVRAASQRAQRTFAPQALTGCALPTLAVVLVGLRKDSQTYVAMKTKVSCSWLLLPPLSRRAALLALLLHCAVARLISVCARVCVVVAVGVR